MTDQTELEEQLAAEPGDEVADEVAEPGEGAEPDEAPVAEPAEDTRSREELVAALEAAQTQRDEYLKDVQRLQAEFENFRKRTMREGAGQRAAGVAELATKLLDVLDDFDMALMSVGSRRDPSSGGTDDVESLQKDAESLHKGLELVYSKLIATLKSVGLERIDGELVPFDPEKHEAVQQVEAEDGPHDHPIVVDVLRPGYELDGRVLRPAMVKVAN